MSKSEKPKSLKKQIDAATRERLKGEIEKVKDPFFESERVMVADSAKTILEIARHVQECQEIFVTGNQIGIAPVPPKGVDFKYFTPQEITRPRERPYVMDREGVLRELEVEVRQEQKLGRTVQTTKIGNGASASDSTMDRWEQKSVLTAGYGFNVYAIGDRTARQAVLDNLTSHPKLVQRLISQRIRISYHPEGNPDLEIELALEPLHCGETFTGFTWEAHKIDLEIKKGPNNGEKALRHSILAREEERLMKIFPLKRQLVSSATPGFEAIMEDLRRTEHQRAFDRMGDRDQWWLDQTSLNIPRVA